MRHMAVNHGVTLLASNLSIRVEFAIGKPKRLNVRKYTTPPSCLEWGQFVAASGVAVLPAGRDATESVVGDLDEGTDAAEGDEGCEDGGDDYLCLIHSGAPLRSVRQSSHLQL